MASPAFLRPPPPRPPLWLSAEGVERGGPAVSAAASARCLLWGAGSQRLTAAGRGRERLEAAHRYRALPSAGRAVNKPLAPLPGPACSPRGRAAAPSVVPPELGEGENSETSAPAVRKQQRNKEKPPQNAHLPPHTPQRSCNRGDCRLSALPGALRPLRSSGAHPPPRRQGCPPRRGGAQLQSPRGIRRPPPFRTPCAGGDRAGTDSAQLSFLLFNKGRENILSCTPLDMFPICRGINS